MQVLEDLGKIGGEFSDESGTAHDLHVVEMCQIPIETYNIETRRTKKFKLDTGAPKSVAGIDWCKQYCLDQGTEFGDLVVKKSRDVFILGNQRFKSLGSIKLTMELKLTDETVRNFEVEVHMIARPVELLIGMNTMRKWRCVLDPEYEVIGLKKKDSKTEIENYIAGCYDGHFVIPLWGITSQKLKDDKVNSWVSFTKM